MTLWNRKTLGLLGATIAIAPPAMAQSDDLSWREVATATDQVRVDEWREALILAVRNAEEHGHGDLLAQDNALYGFSPPDNQRDLSEGAYSCRTIQVAKQAVRGLAYIAYQPFSCRVWREGERLRFEKLSGSQRTSGTIHDAPDMTGDVYLGTWQVSDEREYVPYAQETRRNDVGIVQSIDENRWRIVFPGSLQYGTVEILELRRESARSDG